MLQRRTAPNGVVYYVSPLFEKGRIPHAFSTRIGGISPPPFDSLNLGNPNGEALQDDYDRVWKNYALLEEAAGLSGRERCRVHQVHGGVVAISRCNEPFDSAMKADAIVGDDPTKYLSVRVADCVPILLATLDGRAVSAVHAGWRGVVAGVAAAAAMALRETRDADSPVIVAAIGPSIGFDAFEVGPEVVEIFRQTFGPACPVRTTAHGKGYVDLRAILHDQLIGAGVPQSNIDTTDRCTFRDREEFFSHRRDNGITGRMAAIIGVA